MTQKFKSETDCIWDRKGYCLFTIPNSNTNTLEDVCRHCDWRTLQFSTGAMHKRIRKEKLSISRLYIIARERKKVEIFDKTVGIYKMYEVLEKEFGEENPVKAQLSDPDFVKKVVRMERDAHGESKD